jgi:hypothetical protein
MLNNLKSQKGLAPIIIILIAIVIVVIVGGGIYVWQKTEQAEASPSITLLSPNGGETWAIGSTHTIKWISQNIPQSDKISIYIRRVPPPPLPETGQEFDPVIFIELENTGTVDWTINDMYPAGNYIIEVNKYPSIPVTKVVSDENDAPFRIISSSELTADWKTYRNDNYGYLIKYSKDWKFEGETGVPLSPAFSYRWSDGGYCGFNVVVTSADDSGAIADLIEKGYKKTAYYTFGNGIPSVRLTKSPQDYIYFNQNSDYYRITKNGSKDIHETECTETFNQILSTFKFTR